MWLSEMLFSSLCISSFIQSILSLNTFDTVTPAILLSHRGDPALQPEETAGSYSIASLLGAEFLEPDLVLTKDGHIVCFHDVDLGSITNVAELFPTRVRTASIWNEDRYTDFQDAFLVNDFTLDEIKSLHVNQRVKGVRTGIYDKIFQILTFEEYIDIVLDYSKKLKRVIGMVPELKHPRYFSESMKLPSRYFEDAVLQILNRKGFPAYGNRDEDVINGFTRVTLQCFEQAPLEYLKSKSDFHMMLLVDTNIKFLTPKGLELAAEFADSISFWKEYATVGAKVEMEFKKIPYNQSEVELFGGLFSADQLVSKIHEAGMRAVIYTLYTSTEDSRRYCAIQCSSDSRKDELEYFFEMGVDALFVENISEAKRIKELYYAQFGKEYQVEKDLFTDRQHLELTLQDK